MKYLLLPLLLALLLMGCSANKSVAGCANSCAGNCAMTGTISNTLQSSQQSVQDFTKAYPELRNDIYFHVSGLDDQVNCLEKTDGDDAKDPDTRFLRYLVSDGYLGVLDEMKKACVQPDTEAQRHYISDRVLDAFQQGATSCGCTACGK